MRYNTHENEKEQEETLTHEESGEQKGEKINPVLTDKLPWSPTWCRCPFWAGRQKRKDGVGASCACDRMRWAARCSLGVLQTCRVCWPRTALGWMPH